MLRAHVQRWPVDRNADWIVVDGRVDILDFADHERVVAAHLEREHDFRTAAELLVQQRARIRAAGEEQSVDLPMIRERDARILLALHQVQHAVRQPRVLPHFDRRTRDARCEFRRLEHDCVAGDQRGHDMAVRQVAGEVVRAEHRDDTMRAVTQHRDAVGHVLALLARAFLIGLDRDADLRGHRRDFGACFPQRLARLRPIAVAMASFAFIEQCGETLDDRAARFEVERRPAGECAARACDRAIDVGRRRAFTLPCDLVGAGIARSEHGARACDPGAVDEEFRHDSFIPV